MSSATNQKQMSGDVRVSLFQRGCSLLLSALLLLPPPLFLGCGAQPEVEEALPEGATSCVVVEDPTRPYIVEWSGSQIGTLVQESSLGGVVVSYDGCRTLKILNGCRLTG